MVWIVAAVAAVAVLIAISVYNGLIRLKVQAESAWADIDVQLKRRYDLIPNLLEVVKGYAGHERSVVDAVIAARGRAMGSEGPGAKGQAEGALSGSLKSLFALAEGYPQLRAVESFASLQAALAQTEETLQSARRYYNAVVRDLNTKIAQFPGSIFASTFHVGPREFFEVTNAGEREVPKAAFVAPPA